MSSEEKKVDDGDPEGAVIEEEKDPNDFDPMAEILANSPKPGFVQRQVNTLLNKFRKKKFENEKRMLRKEEQMKQDVERILMEVEEQHSWVTLDHMNHRNLQRLRREELVDSVKRREAKKILNEEDKQNIETGLSYHLGNIASLQRYQNSSSKFQDLRGHNDAVLQVKLSKCLQYCVTASSDCTAKLWCLIEGKSKYPLITYEGHAKKGKASCYFHLPDSLLSFFSFTKL